jgi:excisionase family DNA binding protein
MSKARAKFPVEELTAASRRKTDSEPTSGAPGKIPSWAAETCDLNELSDPEPPRPASHCSAGSSGGKVVRTSLSPVASLMTVAEAAMALRVSTKTIRRMLDQAELRRVGVGRLVRVHAEDVAQYIRDCTSALPYLRM